MTRLVCVLSVLAAICLQNLTSAQETELRQVTEYVTVQERVCEGGVCRLVNVTRPVVRMVRVPIAAAAAVVSDLADVCDCGCGLAGCNCGMAAGSFSELSSAVDYAEIQRVSGLRLVERIRQRLLWRREGRNRAVANFATSGINTRLRGLSLFFPRAWFNLR